MRKVRVGSQYLSGLVIVIDWVHFPACSRGDTRNLWLGRQDGGDMLLLRR